GDDELAAVALLLVSELRGEERGQPDRLEAGMAVGAALLGREDDACPRRTHKELLAEKLYLYASEWDRFRPTALVEPAGDEDRAGLEVDAIVGERDRLGEAQPGSPAEGDDPLHAVRQPRGEPEQLLVLERLTFLSLDADRIDLEDADVDLLPARLSGPQRGLQELELVPRSGRSDSGARGDVVFDLPAPQRGHRRLAERLP